MNLLGKLAEAGASPGFEQEIRELIIEEIRDHVDELRLSRLGSIVATKRAGAENHAENPLKVLVVGGMSQVGFIVKQVDLNGQLHLSPLGEWCPQQYIGRPVLVRTRDSNHQGVIRSSPSHLHEVVVDLGMPEKDVLAIVEIGNLVGLKPDFSEDHHEIGGQTLENIAGIYTLIQVLKSIEKEHLKCHFSVVFTNQEHLRTRKHMQEHFSLSPDMMISLECFKVSQPHCLGNGPIIGSGSKAEPAHPMVIDIITSVAAKHSIPHQISKSPDFNNHTMDQTFFDFGCYMGGVYIPVEAKEPMGLRANKNDIIHTCNLLQNLSTHHNFNTFKFEEDFVVE